ncbi:autoinducer 2 ABC transporter substrate-binding protein [Pseudonocardia acaciae]|uniref:autoinducer 2 ABC transporter substrate-binding protein n=1 Tax=Pseudonocardia acaciae TaxID=551276 RepID=UPI00048ADCF4|nr:autoinducer 2 ABC transporter substrate-binding protein [Pseudonocardia acaciae]
MRALLASVTAGVLALAVAGCGQGIKSNGAAPGGNRYVTVVKLTGVAWFNRMETGVKQFASQTGVDATQTGADDASPEKQVKIIQDLIPQRPTAIAVVPNSPESLEGVLKRARDAGIKVVTHEASDQQNTDVDIEPFDNAAYGAHMVDELTNCMGGSGSYAQLVGHLTAKTHMEWAQGAVDRAKSAHPTVQRVTDPVESQENADVAYNRTKELLARYPDLKGILGSAATDVAGIGRAVQEAGKQNSVCVMGTSVPSVASKYLQDGSIDKIFFWDPATAGTAMMKIAQMLTENKPVTQGTNLGLPGYESLTQIRPNPPTFHGSAWIDVDRNNVGQYSF